LKKKTDDSLKKELKEIALKVIPKNEGLSYTEFCNGYATIYNKSFESGRTLHKKLRDFDIIEKNTENKWIVKI